MTRCRPDCRPPRGAPAAVDHSGPQPQATRPDTPRPRTGPSGRSPERSRWDEDSARFALEGVKTSPFQKGRAPVLALNLRVTTRNDSWGRPGSRPDCFKNTRQNGQRPRADPRRRPAGLSTGHGLDQRWRHGLPRPPHPLSGRRRPVRRPVSPAPRFGVTSRPVQPPGWASWLDRSSGIVPPPGGACPAPTPACKPQWAIFVDVPRPSWLRIVAIVSAYGRTKPPW
jgi:hypothetical protein